jgi:hypothetical protein
MNISYARLVLLLISYSSIIIANAQNSILSPSKDTEQNRVVSLPSTEDSIETAK